MQAEAFVTVLKLHLRQVLSVCQKWELNFTSCCLGKHICTAHVKAHPAITKAVSYIKNSFSKNKKKKLNNLTRNKTVVLNNIPCKTESMQVTANHQPPGVFTNSLNLYFGGGGTN